MTTRDLFLNQVNFNNDVAWNSSCSFLLQTWWNKMKNIRKEKERATNMFGAGTRKGNEPKTSTEQKMPMYWASTKVIPVKQFLEYLLESLLTLPLAQVSLNTTTLPGDISLSYPSAEPKELISHGFESKISTASKIHHATLQKKQNIMLQNPLSTFFT